MAVGDSVSTGMLVLYLTRMGLDAGRGVLRLLVAARLPRLLFLAVGARIHGVRLLRFGRRLRLGRGSHVTCWSPAGIILGDDVSFGEFCQISNGFNPFAQIGTITIGNNVGIGGYSYICSPAAVTIGCDTITGQYLSIHPQDHLFADRDRPIRLQGTRSRGIVIGRDCWIGAKVTILDGVTLGDGCVVAAGAVVNRSFPPGSVIGGVPAKPLASR
ncbi:acyltransferase [Sphingomonas sp. DT-51]|uniref:acyltransferase n=1 Tax=Sphingomonas sp. DT-51 TaxID=3396165 RepID=UPI003F1BBB69